MLGYQLQATKDHSRFLKNGDMQFPRIEREGTYWVSSDRAFELWTEYEIQRRIRSDGRPRLRMVARKPTEHTIHTVVRSKPPFVEQICRLDQTLVGPDVRFGLFTDIAKQGYRFTHLIELVGANEELERLELWRIMAYYGKHQSPDSAERTFVATSHVSDAIAIKIACADNITRMWNADGELVDR